jgi:hypothetical protein
MGTIKEMRYRKVPEDARFALMNSRYSHSGGGIGVTVGRPGEVVERRGLSDKSEATE